MDKNKGTVSVIGLGYVGLPLALLAARKNYKVYGVDIDSKKVADLKNKVAPFADEKISQELTNTTMEATDSFEVVKESDFVIICVPTPVYENHLPNLEPIRGALKGVGPYLKKGQTIILESTVNPGVSEGIVIPMLEEISSLRAGFDFHVVHCPERINPGDKKWNVENIPRVIGSLEEVGLEKAAKFYESIITSSVKRMGSLKEAEAVKIVENSFRDINIAFVNELAQSFSKLGIDVVKVIDGAATKPFAFMAHYPGSGVGGHCIPVDPYYLIEYAKENGFNHRFLSLARTINNEMPEFTASLVKEGLAEKNTEIEGSTVAVLGLSYKEDIDDCRESPSFKIIKQLKDLGARVVSYDPYVQDKSTAKDLNEAVNDTDAVVLATKHTIFKEKLTPEFLAGNKVKVIVDGRNCLPWEEFSKVGIIYKGIGRPSKTRAIIPETKVEKLT